MTNPDDRLEQWIRTRVVELVESSPEPPPFRGPPGSAPTCSAAVRITRFAAAACIAAVGVLAAVSIWGGSGRDVAAAVLIRIRAPVGGTVTGRFARAAIRDGHVDWERVPRLLAIVNASGSVLGYMMKNDLDGTNTFIGPNDGGTYAPACGSEGIDIYNATMTKIVGSYYPNAGFVPAGTTPTCR